MSDETSENRWEQRLSPLIVKGGVLPAPSVLLRHAGELNLTPQELVLCLYILDKKWGSDWPYVSMLQAADELGRHKNKVYAWKKSLVQKGYLKATPRTVPGIGRRADYCDLSGLYAALERLVLAEAVQQARGHLPLPLFEADHPQAPAWLAAGDRLSWQPVDAPTHAALAADWAAGRLRREDFLMPEDA